MQLFRSLTAKKLVGFWYLIFSDDDDPVTARVIMLRLAYLLDTNIEKILLPLVR